MPDGHDYDETYDPGWIVEVGRTFRYWPSMGSWVFGGTCPRCGHPTSQSVTDTIEVRMLTPELAPAPHTFHQLVVRCQCTTQHGKDKVGCGRSGILRNVVFR